METNDVWSDRMFDIANVPLTQVPQEERMHYLTKAREVGYFRGYKMPKYFVRRPSQLLGLEHGLTSSWYSQHIDNGVRDQIDHYASTSPPTIHRDFLLTSTSPVIRPAFEQQHPKGLTPFLPEIRVFMAHNHFNVLHPDLR